MGNRRQRSLNGWMKCAARQPKISHGWCTKLLVHHLIIREGYPTLHPTLTANNNMGLYRIELVLVEIFKAADGSVSFGKSLKAKGSQVHLPQGQFDRAGGPLSAVGDALAAFEEKWNVTITSDDLHTFKSFKGDIKKIAYQLRLDVFNAGEVDNGDEAASPPVRKSSLRASMVSPLKEGEGLEKKQKRASAKKRKAARDALAGRSKPSFAQRLRKVRQVLSLWVGIK